MLIIFGNYVNYLDDVVELETIEEEDTDDEVDDEIDEDSDELETNEEEDVVDDDDDDDVLETKEELLEELDSFALELCKLL